MTLGREPVPSSAALGQTADPGLRSLRSKAKNTPGGYHVLRDTGDLGNGKEKGHCGEPGCGHFRAQ